jgi:hypothetical protein
VPGCIDMKKILISLYLILKAKKRECNLNAYLIVEPILYKNICERLGKVSPIMVPGDVLQRKTLRNILPLLVDIAAGYCYECLMITFSFPHVSNKANF